MSDRETPIRTLVHNWLVEVQRRGAELYARNQGNGFFIFRCKERIGFDTAYRLVLVPRAENRDQSARLEMGQAGSISLKRGQPPSTCKTDVSPPWRQAVIPVYL